MPTVPALQKRKAKCLIEMLQKMAVHVFGKLCRPVGRQIFQCLHPQSFVPNEQIFPSVQSRDRNPGTVTNVLHTRPAQKIVPERLKDKS